MGLGQERFRYESGLQEVGADTYAWLSPDGSWGWSNAGLVVDGDESLVVDTLFDLRLTSEMLAAMSAVAPAAMAQVDRLVNTHANGDHCHGNELVGAGEIIASSTSATEMAELPPNALAALMDAFADGDAATSTIGQYLRDSFGGFEFHGITLTLPTRTFDRRLDLTVGDTPVELHEVGPAHTGGDVIVHLPTRGTVFTGDILFVEGTPIMWVGPIANWIEACDLIASFDADVVVPGHGPITDQRGVQAVRDYLTFVRDEVRLRFDSGLSIAEAAADIDLGAFAGWTDRERIVANVAALYRELGSDEQLDIVGLFAAMADYRQATAA